MMYQGTWRIVLTLYLAQGQGSVSRRSLALPCGCLFLFLVSASGFPQFEMKFAMGSLIFMATVVFVFSTLAQ